jgi:hypothetical protein
MIQGIAVVGVIKTLSLSQVEFQPLVAWVRSDVSSVHMYFQRTCKWIRWNESCSVRFVRGDRQELG